MQGLSDCVKECGLDPQGNGELGEGCKVSVGRWWHDGIHFG